MKKKGRPRLPLEHHIGKDNAQKFGPGWKDRLHRYDRKMDYTPDDPTYPEAKEILIRVYDTLGPTAALGCLLHFEAHRLQELSPKLYSRFIALCQEKLGQTPSQTLSPPEEEPSPT